MAEVSSEKSRYPQIPSTVWWGVHKILNRSPQTVIDERLLTIELGVQENAAKQYLNELISVGIINQDKKATPLGLEWRLDEKYEGAVRRIIENIYPQSLRDIALPPDGDRQKAESWFKHEGFGEGAAKNKSATYFRIGSPKPNDVPLKQAKLRDQSQQSAGTKDSQPQRINKTKPLTKSSSKGGDEYKNSSGDHIPLNVNVQIHISADAGPDQIESIFAAMRRYLYDKEPA